MSEGIKVNGEEVTKVVTAMRGRLAEALRSGMLLASEHAAGTIRRTLRTMGQQRRGGLSRSFKATILVDEPGHIKGGAFSDLVYARIQDRGGTIRPKSVQALAVPLSEKAKNTVGLWPRHWPKGKLFMIKTGRGIYLAEPTKSKFKLNLHYVLMRAVGIKGTRYLDASRPDVLLKAKQILQREVRTAVAGSSKGAK
jgi:hypothetical protein